MDRAEGYHLCDQFDAGDLRLDHIHTGCGSRKMASGGDILVRSGGALLSFPVEKHQLHLGHAHRYGALSDSCAILSHMGRPSGDAPFRRDDDLPDRPGYFRHRVGGDTPRAGEGRKGKTRSALVLSPAAPGRFFLLLRPALAKARFSDDSLTRFRHRHHGVHGRASPTRVHTVCRKS